MHQSCSTDTLPMQGQHCVRVFIHLCSWVTDEPWVRDTTEDQPGISCFSAGSHACVCEAIMLACGRWQCALQEKPGTTRMRGAGYTLLCMHMHAMHIVHYTIRQIVTTHAPPLALAATMPTAAMSSRQTPGTDLFAPPLKRLGRRQGVDAHLRQESSMLQAPPERGTGGRLRAAGGILFPGQPGIQWC